MNEYELLLEDISEELPVIEFELEKETGLKAAYEDNTIFLDKNLNRTEKKIFLSEEYSHHKTSVGNIIDYNDAKNRKQEWKARRDSIERLVSLDDLIECSFSGYTTKYDCADFLGITEEFLLEVLAHYRTKHGSVHIHEGYIFHFDDHGLRIINSGLA